MFVVKDIAHRGGINYPEYPSPRAFSARSFLDSTMSCDVTERDTRRLADNSPTTSENAFSRPLSPRLRADNGSRENA